MQQIMFKPPTDKKILSGEKTMTARCWKREPPEVGDNIYASTGYKKETRFAILTITHVSEWDGKNLQTNAEAITGMSKQEIAKAEGFNDRPDNPSDWFTNWDDFTRAYHKLNAQKPFDKDRKHYFIQFKVTHKLENKPPPPLLDVFVNHSAHGKYMVPEGKTEEEAVNDLKKE